MSRPSRGVKQVAAATGQPIKLMKKQILDKYKKSRSNGNKLITKKYKSSQRAKVALMNAKRAKSKPNDNNINNNNEYMNMGN